MLWCDSISLDGTHTKRNQGKHFVITSFQKIPLFELTLFRHTFAFTNYREIFALDNLVPQSVRQSHSLLVTPKACVDESRSDRRKAFFFCRVCSSRRQGRCFHAWQHRPASEIIDIYIHNAGVQCTCTPGRIVELRSDFHMPQNLYLR